MRMGLVIGEGGDFSVREEEFPAIVAPEHFQRQESLIASGAPELAAAFHATLQLAAGGFDGTGAERFIAAGASLYFMRFWLFW